MDEVKIYQLTKLPFPRFDNNIKEQIIKVYYNKNESNLGIFQLSLKKIKAEQKLKNKIDNLLKNK